MKILIVGPMQVPQVAEIKGDFNSMKAIIGDSLEIKFPFADSVATICNGDWCDIGLPMTRKIFYGNHEVERIFGTFIVCGTSREDGHFRSLTDEQIEKYTNELMPNDFNCKSDLIRPY